MGEIVDYYKNSKFYQSELTELIPLPELEYQSDIYLHQLVQKFDELTFGSKSILDAMATSTSETESSLIYEIDDDFSVGFYFNSLGNFVIELFLSGEYTIDNNDISVSHIFTKNKNIIDMERDRRKGFPYIPNVNLLSMTMAHVNEQLSEEEINIISTNLEMTNKSLEKLYNKYNRPLLKKKEE